MTIADNINKIKELQELDLPHKVRCALPNIQIHGDQICLTQDSDYMSLEETKEVVEWLYEQLNRTPTTIILKSYPKPALKCSNLTKKQIKELKKAIKDEVKECKEHFSIEDGGWDLDYSHVFNEIIYKTFGLHLSDLLWHEIMKKGMGMKLDTINKNLRITKVEE